MMVIAVAGHESKEEKSRGISQSPDVVGVLGRESDHDVHVNSPEQVTKHK